MRQWLKHIIQHDKVVFILNLQCWFNIRRCIMYLNALIRKRTKNRVIITKILEKKAYNKGQQFMELNTNTNNSLT